jgi:hypothetical protein
MQQLQTETIAKFLETLDVNFAKDLTCRYNHDMEVQVNVDDSLGNLVHGGSNVWERVDSHFGTFRYWHIRIPKNAKGHVSEKFPTGEPFYEDKPLMYPLHVVAQEIGMTGWDWASRRSLWVGFDFDSIAGHAPGVGLSDDQLEEIRQILMGIPWVQVRRSTGGKGMHVYAYFDPDNAPVTENHTLHGAAARAVLGLMAREVGFDFHPHVDCYGGNMWVWSRRITPANKGLELIKNHEDYIPYLPENWKDNVDVIKGSRTKVRVEGVSDHEAFDATTSAIKRIELSNVHKQVEDRIANMGYTIVWNPDHFCWSTHTKSFEELMLDHPEDYNGIYETLSEGTDKGKPNCFVFPLPQDAFRVVRFSRGTREAECWNQEGDWTWIYFNRAASLRAASSYFGGVEDPDNGNWIFTDVRHLRKAIESLGGHLPLESSWESMFTGPDEKRAYALRANKKGDIIAEITAKKDEKPPKGWILKKGKFLKRLNIRAEETRSRTDEEYDNACRALVGPSGDLAGWVICDSRTEWVGLDKGNARSVLKAKGEQDPEVLMGHLAMNSWKLVNVPFQPEYPGNREWNREAAQFRYEPGERGPHPHWDLILKHCGQHLDEPISEDKWCLDNGIMNGRDYLLKWVASLFRHPYDSLPYLFFYGPQNSGKTSFHEAVSTLITTGSIDAGEALKSQAGFNGELATAILCVVEETNLSAHKQAYNRLKAWVTGTMIRIRPMYQPVYMQRNTTHWVQCSNSVEEIPSFPGDTRIVMCWVPRPEREIPKEQLHQALRAEAPQFMRTLLDTQLPSAPGRLRLPAIETATKREAEQSNQDALARFLDTCHYVDGASTPFKDFYSAFRKTLQPNEVPNWSQPRVSNCLREMGMVTVGRISQNKTVVANLLLKEPSAGAVFGNKWIAVPGTRKLRRKGDDDDD